MSWTGRDLTIDAALADPMIRAVMRADRVEPQWLEASLRATARGLETARRAADLGPGALMARRHSVCAVACGW